MSYKPLFTAAQSRGHLCVVIERDENGNEVVYADDGVMVFGRFPNLTTDLLYEFCPQRFPKHWLDLPAENLGPDAGSVEIAHHMLSNSMEFEIESDNYK